MMSSDNNILPIDDIVTRLIQIDGNIHHNNMYTPIMMDIYNINEPRVLRRGAHLRVYPYLVRTSFCVISRPLACNR